MDTPLQNLLISGAAEMGVSLDETAIARFSVFLDLLQRWGKKINLTTRLAAKEVIIYHFLDSLAGVPVLAAAPNGRVVDLGAGAGLPSLPLKFALPGLRLLLVESIRKKVSFCQEVIRATDSAEVKVVWGRGEVVGLRTEHHRSFDWAVIRALGQSADVARLALPFLTPGGRILLYKGEPDASELRAIDTFCSEHGAVRQLRQVTVPHLKGARCLITISLPTAAAD